MNVVQKIMEIQKWTMDIKDVNFLQINNILNVPHSQSYCDYPVETFSTKHKQIRAMLIYHKQSISTKQLQNVLRFILRATVFKAFAEIL